MTNLREQLAELRARVAQVNARYSERVEPPFSLPSRTNEARSQPYIEEWLGGEEVETEYGRHYETEKLFPSHQTHGSADIGALSDLPPDLLDAISDGTVSAASPDQWAFLDTETTGLAASGGACAFLVGVGRITPEGFRVRQFFMRDFAEEASLLDSLTRHLALFRVLITYNGRAFDEPLLETRYRLNRSRSPFPKLQHLDLLYGARRLWKLRYDSCRLVDLETQVLGVEREGDIPGALIPYVYFEYLRTQRAARLLHVFHHNATDILSLACLTSIVPCAFRDPMNLPFRNGAEITGIARWLSEAGECERALQLFRRAVDRGLPDDLMFRTLWDIAALERKRGSNQAALDVWNDLAAARNPFRVKALEELAKHYEHHEKNRQLALEMTRAALIHEDSPSLRRREQRLERHMSNGRTPKRSSTVKRKRIM